MRTHEADNLNHEQQTNERKPNRRVRLNRRQRRTLGDLVRQVQAFILRSVPSQEVCHG